MVISTTRLVFYSEEKKGAYLFSARTLFDRFIVLPLKDFALFGTWGKPSIPKTTAPLSPLPPQFESAARYRISDIAAQLRVTPAFEVLHMLALGGEGRCAAARLQGEQHGVDFSRAKHRPLE